MGHSQQGRDIHCSHRDARLGMSMERKIAPFQGTWSPEDASVDLVPNHGPKSSNTLGPRCSAV